MFPSGGLRQTLGYTCIPHGAKALDRRMTAAEKLSVWVKPWYLRRGNEDFWAQTWDRGHSLKEASFVLLFIVGSKLDLALEAGELTGLVEGDRVRAVQDVISCLQSTRKGGECGMWGRGCLPAWHCSNPSGRWPRPLHTCT